MILIGVAEALDGEAVVLGDSPVLQESGHKRHAAAEVAHGGSLDAGGHQYAQHHNGDQHAGDLLFGVQQLHDVPRDDALFYHDIGEPFLF